MNQKNIDLIIEMLKDLKAKNAELSQNLASLQKDYHEVVKSLASLQSNNNTAAPAQSAQSQTNTTASKSLSDIPQPRASRVKEILAGVRKTQEPAQQGESKESKKGVTESYTPISTSGATSFSNNDLGNVRIVMQDNEPMFCLSDVAKILEIQNIRQLKPMLDKEFDKGGIFYIHPLETAGGKQNFTFIDEPELYFVLMRSNSAKAKPFRQWVTKEVLPSIRKTGSYQSNNQESLKRYEALFGGKFSVQTPCKQFIMQNIAQAEAKHNAIATELVSYNYTEEFKKGKANITSRIGLVYDRPVSIDKKPIITKGYLSNELLRENQSSITANAESKSRKRKCQ